MNRHRPARSRSVLAGSTSDLGPVWVPRANSPAGNPLLPAVGQGGRPSPGAQHQPELRNESRRCNILPVGKGPGVRGAAGGGEGHAPGPRPGRKAGGWTDGWDWGAQAPGGALASPGGKALEEKRNLPPPSSVPRGSVPPHPHPREAAARLCDVNISQHPTDNPQHPGPPSAGGRTH